MQGELSAALATLARSDVPLVVAGRTDRGVHALGQVVSHPGEPVSLKSLNAILPPDVSALRAEEVPGGFSARRDAVSRTYVYRVHTRRWGPSPFEVGRALWWRHRCDLDLLQACAAALVGHHDFTAFTPSRTYHQRFDRTIDGAGWTRASGELLEFRIEGRAFMRAMNRILVGTMLEVAGGRRSLEDFVSLLGGAPRAAAGPTAVAHGLYLASVQY